MVLEMSCICLKEFFKSMSSLGKVLLYPQLFLKLDLKMKHSKYKKIKTVFCSPSLCHSDDAWQAYRSHLVLSIEIGLVKIMLSRHWLISKDHHGC